MTMKQFLLIALATAVLFGNAPLSVGFSQFQVARTDLWETQRHVIKNGIEVIDYLPLLHPQSSADDPLEFVACEPEFTGEEESPKSEILKLFLDSYVACISGIFHFQTFSINLTIRQAEFHQNQVKFTDVMRC